MTSHDVTSHVTAVSHASSLSIKEKENQKKRNLKSKRKILVLTYKREVGQDGKKRGGKFLQMQNLERKILL